MATNERNSMHNAMRKIPELEAQADFDCLLDDVENGESVLITRDGRTIARIVPNFQIAEGSSTTLKSSPQGLKLR
jgi:antitoxin (DNA-binding transcriptional repressor) of toxin-antitoxin stability system